MTDLALPTPQAAELHTYQQTSIDRLQRWAEQAVAVRQMADTIVNTSFCPQAYRGKPDEATAAILAGAELGFDPMASLRAFDSIQGTPAPKAMTLRAVAQAAGHRVRIVRSSDTEAVVAGLRKGEQDWQESTWTIDRAERMGLTGKAQWKQQPAAMLVARATSEVCRWIASDAIMGMPYSAEEIADTTGLHAAPSTTRVTAADIIGQAVTHVEQRPAIVEGPDPNGPASQQQRQDIAELLYDRGVTDEQALDGIRKVVGRHLDSSADLTSAEAELVIASLTRAQDQP
jgi:hypothetical protein